MTFNPVSPGDRAYFLLSLITISTGISSILIRALKAIQSPTPLTSHSYSTQIDFPCSKIDIFTEIDSLKFTGSERNLFVTVRYSSKPIGWLFITWNKQLGTSLGVGSWRYASPVFPTANSLVIHCFRKFFTSMYNQSMALKEQEGKSEI